MWHLAGCDYGEADFLDAAMFHLPLVRLTMRVQTEDHAIDRRDALAESPEFAWEVRRAEATAGIDPYAECLLCGQAEFRMAAIPGVAWLERHEPDRFSTVIVA
jgi:hypothetical protein